jgi:hypothetical protein
LYAFLVEFGTENEEPHLKTEEPQHTTGRGFSKLFSLIVTYEFCQGPRLGTQSHI